MSESNDNRYDRRDGPRDRALRVGDRERDAVAEILRERHLEGRLDNDEFQTRLERCLAAKTYADLDALIADFPSDERAESLGAWRWRPWPVFLPIVLIALIVLSHGHLAWLAFPLVFFFLVRAGVWRAWGGPSRRAWACAPGRTRRA